MFNCERILQEAGTWEGDLKRMSGPELKSKIVELDTEKWRNDEESKITLAVYN